MLAEISARQILKWRAFEQVEPFGERRADERLAQVLAMMANLWAGGDRQWKVEDFLSSYDDEEVPRTEAARNLSTFEGMWAAYTAFRAGLPSETEIERLKSEGLWEP
jgi:hypothetical protein